MKSLKNIKKLKLKIIKVKEGNIMRAMDAQILKKVKLQDVYFSKIKYKKIKAWKYHRKKQLILIVPKGRVKFVFFNQEKKLFKKYIIGEKNYCRLIIPPKIWFGFTGLSKEESIIINFSNYKNIKNETLREDLKNFPYKW